MLRRLGYRAEAVADGREVMQALEIQALRPGLDGCQDAGDGWARCNQMIRKLRPGNGPKIVAITAYGLEGRP